MKRVTKKDLQAIVDRINRIKNTPQTTYTRKIQPDGTTKLMANVGNYHLIFAYGGVSLRQISNESGGTCDVLLSGHVPKRELQRLLVAYIKKIEDAV